MKIYTKTGDKGSTSLFGGGIVSKDNIRIEAFGTVDELNSHIGLLTNMIQDEELIAKLIKIQNELFVLGSLLAKNPAKKNAWIPDEMDTALSPLQNFILPGGSKGSAQAHICRCVCRRAERRVVTLKELEPETESISIIYLNRLSDALFTLARTINQRLSISEVNWDSGRNNQ
jgi:cob(I)alamin adenosyltransferase